MICLYIYIYPHMVCKLRALASAAVGSEGGVAGADLLVTSGSRWDAVTTLTACPTRPLAYLLP